MTNSSLTPLVRIRVAVDAPQHSGLSEPLDYWCEHALAPGTLVQVPLGKREVTGLVWPGASAEGEVDADTLRPVSAVLEALEPLSVHWCELVAFAARYYQRSVGEVALSVLPPQLRQLNPTQLQARLKRMVKWLAN